MHPSLTVTYLPAIRRDVAVAPMQRSSTSVLARVEERFPGKAALVRQRLLASAEFRSICEDYGAALDTLAYFRARPDADERPEIAEYEVLIGELEAELAALLEAGQGAPGSDRPAETARWRRGEEPE